MRFRKNQVVDYYDSRKIACGLILETDDRRLRILTEQGKDANISVSRILISTYDPNFPFTGDRNQQVARLKELSRLREELKNQINLRELWEVVGPETGSVSIEDLSELVFGRKQDVNGAPSLLRAIRMTEFILRF